MFEEFKKFILRGNVVDLAIAVIMGAAFGGIVNSLVNDVIMPPIGLITGRVNFSDLYINLSGASYESLDAAVKAGAPVIKYGVFLNAVINFLIVSFAVFMLVRLVNQLQKPKAADPPALPTPSRQEELLTEIRDLLRERR
ncbi:MAG: large conductance mechanosensitive channel protein MscL [Cyanobacteriota bacterium]|nr:large conductance mechanosensitive channel protein MscL [Cyanobacteriota bacterium]